ncbi:MAG: MFS transporter [Methanomicrobiales archaeon]|nr:MFS transporter [Methanomicrobiales archaeon]MDI6875178.1 MFS transporter [Methanomicrobiales archaeon]
MKLTDVKDTLTEEEIRRGLNAVIKDGLTTQTMTTLTGGIFLVAFALQLGASNLMIGLLSALPPLAQLIQIPGVYLVEKYRARRAISVYASALNRSLWLLVAAIPLLFSGSTGIIVLVGAVFLNAALGSIGGCSWNSWMRDLIPQDRLGAFFSKRMFQATCLGIVVSWTAGMFIDHGGFLFPENAVYCYSILFVIGFIVGMVGLYYLSIIPEPRMETYMKDPSFYRLLLQPFADSNFRQLIRFMGSWNFAINLASPFFTVYMIQILHLPMSAIVALSILSQMTNVAFLQIWGRFSDRFSNKSVLQVCGPLFLICIFAWTFTTMPDAHILTMPLLVAIHAFMGVSTAGVTLASGNIGLKLAPRGQATSYLAGNSLVNSIAAGVAPVIGGVLADFFSSRELSWTLRWTSPYNDLTFQTLDLTHWDFLFAFAVIIGIYSMHRLALVQEMGEVREKVVVEELFSEVKREMRNFSTAGGLRYMIQFPFSAVNNLREKVRQAQQNGLSTESLSSGVDTILRCLQFR